jgi:hypothetical protein
MTMQRQAFTVTIGILAVVLTMTCETSECGTDAIPATRTPAPLADHSRTDRLERDFGFRVQVPTNWREPEYGVIVPQPLKFGWAWSAPKGLDGTLHVEIAAAPVINGHVLVCTRGDLASDFSKDVLKSGFTPVDFESGQVLAEPRVKVKYFTGVEPPAPVGFEEPYTRDEKVILLACGATHAYLDPAHNERVQFLTRIYGKYCVYTVRLETAKAFTPSVASDYSRIVNSISMRCGENGSQWCRSK